MKPLIRVLGVVKALACGSLTFKRLSASCLSESQGMARDDEHLFEVPVSLNNKSLFIMG
jgi:hypothetical protein